MQHWYYHQPQTRESQRNRAPKRAKTTNKHHRNHSKKQSSENNSTISVRKNSTNTQKTKEEHKTSEKNYFERKKYSVQTTKGTKGIRKTKQYSEAGQESPKQVANRSPKKFRFHFLKKKWINQHLKKKHKISIGREKGWNSTHSSSIGSCKTHERIRGSQIVRMTPTECVSWKTLVRYLTRNPVKFGALSVSAMWLA